MSVIRRIQARSILTRSNIPGFHFALNPYRGCIHSCKYCYAEFMSKYREQLEKWGTFVDVKINAVKLLYKELPKAYRKRIIISSVTDPYQPVEKQEEITRKILKLLIPSQASICLLTKSSLITRDLDLLTEFGNIEVGFSVTLVEKSYRIFEPFASAPKDRFEALRKLSSRDVHTFVFMAPLLPGLTESRTNLRAILKSAADSGCREILIDQLSLYSYVRKNLYHLYKDTFPEKANAFCEYNNHRRAYLKRFKEAVIETAYHLNLEKSMKIRFFF